MLGSKAQSDAKIKGGKSVQCWIWTEKRALPGEVSIQSCM